MMTVSTMFNLSNPRESLSNLACHAIGDNQMVLKNSTGLSFDEILSGEYSNEVLAGKFIDALKQTLDLNPRGTYEVSKSVIQNLESYGKLLRESGALSATALASFDGFVDTMRRASEKLRDNTAKENGVENDTTA